MTDYNALKVTELKDLCKERGIQLTGAKRKAEYVEALEAKDNEDGVESAPADGVAPDGGDVDMAEAQPAETEPTNDAEGPEDDAAIDRKRKRDAPEPVEDAAAKRTRTDEERTNVPRSEHPPTAALYIKNLSRPLQESTFRSELSALADDDQGRTIVDLHLDSLKTHALVLCSSSAAAQRIRTAAHGRPWPQTETQRKSLFVDFIPEESVRVWIDQEVAASRDARFEVKYSQDRSGKTIADLVELNAQPVQAPREQQEEQPIYEDEPMEEAEAPPGPVNKLDEYFSYTTSKPKIYFKPVEAELANSRLQEFDRETARDWQNGKAWNRSTRLAPVDQLRRYTFDDGYKIVDGGVDFGGFGRRQGAGGTGGYNAAYPRGGGGAGNGPRRYRPN